MKLFVPLVGWSFMKAILSVSGHRVFFGLCLLGCPILAGAAVTEEFHQTYPLTANGELRLDNVNGKVRITAWDRAEVKVDAIKRAQTQEALDALQIEATAKPEQVRIHTEYPKGKANKHQKNDSASVDYELKVPAGVHLEGIEVVNANVEIEGVTGRVNASTVNGTLTVKGLASDSKLETVNGSVEAAFQKFDGVKSVTLKSVNGELQLKLPSDTNAEVSAKSLNGTIHGDAGLTVTKKFPVGSDLHGTLGKGEARIKLETVNGSIRVRSSGTATSLLRMPVVARN
jgi:DUF4097 and DUF4098 domain-containing protein YvlB